MDTTRIKHYKKSLEKEKGKIIYVCSPLRGDIENNIKKVYKYCRLVLESGNYPVAPHAYGSNLLDDNNPKERKLALKMGEKLLSRCDELWYFGEIISEGMEAEIKFAKKNAIPVYHQKTLITNRTKALSI